MASTFEDKERKVVPRWRPFQVSNLQGELDSLTPPTRTKLAPNAPFERRLREWSQHKSASFAADLLSHAIIIGVTEPVRPAAESLLKSCAPFSEGAQRIAQEILGIQSAGRPMLAALQGTALHDTIRGTRAKLHNEPRNAIRWMELAYFYTLAGQPTPAQRATEIAISLAPANRFIVRSAARCFLHMDAYDRAYQVLSSCPTLTSDPWILAAEIAIAGAARRSPQGVRRARRMIQHSRFKPRHISELACSLATIEFEAGNSRTAKRLMDAALEEPSENAIAQAAWLRRKKLFRPVGPTWDAAVARSAEARAWSAWMNEQWFEVVQFSEEWLRDQPFSSRPAILGSYVAAVVNCDFDGSLRITTQARMSNPHDFNIINNHAFALAQLDRHEEASRVFAAIRNEHLSEIQKIAWLATSGLLNFRMGRTNEGRDLYRQSINQAGRAGDSYRRAVACTYWALEEARIGSDSFTSVGRAALSYLERCSGNEFQSLSKRLREKLHL